MTKEIRLEIKKVRAKVIEAIIPHIDDPDFQAIIAYVNSYMDFIETALIRHEKSLFVKYYIHLRHHLYLIEDYYPAIYAEIHKYIIYYVKMIEDEERRVFDVIRN